jgi:type I restriction enzyme M protein
LLRLPTGIFYAGGVKANVLFFDKRPAAEKPWTTRLWVYDFRTNQHFTQKTMSMKRSSLDEFVEVYKPDQRSSRVESERFKAFSYDELTARDKVNLDLIWLKDDSLEDVANLPAPEVIAREIMENLESALSEFSAIVEVLEGEKGV